MFNKNELTEYQISVILKDLNVETSNNPNRKAWTTISSPLREDDTPSFAINYFSGGWVDNGTGETGSIIDLIKEIKGLKNNQQVKDYLDILLNRFRPSSIRMPNGKIRLSGKENESDQLIDMDTAYPVKDIDPSEFDFDPSDYENLSTFSDSELAEKILEHDGLTQKTLALYNCRINKHYDKTELVIPYGTGAQIYSRDQNDDHEFHSISGSTPTGTYFGLDQLSSHSSLIIAKSPREAMLVKQELGSSLDVISICTGERSDISPQQEKHLQKLSQDYDHIFVIMDCDTEKAEQITTGLANNVKRTVADSAAVYIINITEVSDGKHKDLADLHKADELYKIMVQVDNKIAKKETVELPAEASTATDIKEEPVTTSQPKAKVFWSSRGTIKKAKLLRSLEDNGFFKTYIQEEQKNFHIKDNIIYPIDESKLKDLIRHMLDDFDSTTLGQDMKDEVLDSLITLNSKNLLDSARVVKSPHLVKDGKEYSYLFYKNCYLKITCKGVSSHEYEELEGSIWADDIIDRDAPTDFSKPQDCEFEEFVRLATGNDTDRMKSACSCLGYLLHRFKDSTKAKAIVVVDEKIGYSNSSDGGTGKSIYARALDYLRPFKPIDGKHFNSDSRFAFMDVSELHDIVLLDDVREHFAFADLFVSITGDMSVERKHKDRVHIPFERSPKIIITSNDPLEGSGNSYDRRQIILEFSDYFRKGYTPEQHFNHSLFADWSDQEWKKFDRFMISCLQEYLSNGLHEKNVNYERRKLINETSMAFVDWAEKYLETDVEYDQRHLFRGTSTLDLESSGYKDFLQPKNSEGEFFPSYRQVERMDLDEKQQRTFNKYIETYCSINGWIISKRESSGQTLITLLIDKKKKKS